MKCYIVDAFTKEIFKGNPAAVCVLDQWLPDELIRNGLYRQRRRSLAPALVHAGR